MHVRKIGFVEWRHLEQLSITLIEDSTLDHLWYTDTFVFEKNIFNFDL